MEIDARLVCHCDTWASQGTVSVLCCGHYTRLKNNKSPGNVGITGEMIKYGGDIVVQEIYDMCSAVWKEGRTPDEWKKSILIILHKKGSATRLQ